MTATYYQVAASQVLSSSTAYVEFTSIPSNYTDLIIKISARTSASVTGEGASTLLTVNGSSTYVTKRFAVYGSTRTDLTEVENPGTSIKIGGLPGASSGSNIFSNDEVYINNYSDSNNKIFNIPTTSLNNISSGWWITGTGGTWQNSAAISSIKLTPSSGSYVAYSSFTLYGIIKH
jgi:hypothetical protein